MYIYHLRSECIHLSSALIMILVDLSVYPFPACIYYIPMIEMTRDGIFGTATISYIYLYYRVKEYPNFPYTCLCIPSCSIQFC